MSLRRRFTLLAATVVTVTVLVVGGGLYAVFASQQQSQMDGRLRVAGLKARTLERIGTGIIRMPGRPGVDPSFALLLAPDGSALSRSPNADTLDLAIPQQVRTSASSGTDELVTVSSGGQDYRVLVIAAPPLRSSPIAPPTGAAAVPQPIEPGQQTASSPSGSVLVIGQSTQSIDDALRPLRWMLAGAAGVSLVLGALGGWLVARRALRPVTELSLAVDRIGHGGDMSRRLPVPQARDELATLTENFNASLARIETGYSELEASLDRQRRFVADASHELRTPLTTLRSDVELLRRHPAMPDDDRTALVEREDFGSGTSSRSSKLVHGGLRYLRQGDYRLVAQQMFRRVYEVHPRLAQYARFVDLGPGDELERRASERRIDEKLKALTN